MKNLRILAFSILASWCAGSPLVAQAPGPPSESVSIHALDRIISPSGEVRECLILDPNPTLGTDLKVRIRTVTTVVKAAEIKQIIPRQIGRAHV